MKSILMLVALSLCVTPLAQAQKRKGSSSRSKSTGRSRSSAKKPAADTTAAAPTITGSPVIITTRDGNKITGQIVDLNVSAVRVKASDQESSVQLTAVSSLSFGTSSDEGAPPAGSPRHPDFQKDAGAVMSGFHGMLGEARTGPDYTEYGGQLVELRRRAELFIGRYGSTEDPVEARVVAGVASAVTDYTWARTIWALKLGHSGDVTVSRSDSPAVADTVGLYPDVKAAAASGDRFSVEKLIVGLWTQAGIKVDRLRSLIGQMR
jgi:hypothetical protein